MRRRGKSSRTFPHLKRWFEAIKGAPRDRARPYEKGAAISSNNTMTEEAKKILFGQTSQTKPRGAEAASGISGIARIM